MKLKSISGALAFAGVAVAGLAAANTAQAQATLAQIKQRGAMNCGVDTGLAGFAFKDDKGAWRGLDVDYCRAIAAAVLKDPEKVNYVPLTTKLRFTALKAGDVDVLIRNFDADFHPRHSARAKPCRRQLLCRPRIHGEGEPRREKGDGP